MSHVPNLPPLSGTQEDLTANLKERFESYSLSVLMQCQIGTLDKVIKINRCIVNDRKRNRTHSRGIRVGDIMQTDSADASYYIAMEVIDEGDSRVMKCEDIFSGQYHSLHSSSIRHAEKHDLVRLGAYFSLVASVQSDCIDRQWSPLSQAN